MTIVVGVAPSHVDPAAVHLGALLARSYGAELVLAAVTSVGWPAGTGSAGSVDGEYQRFLHERAETQLSEARALVPADLTVRTRVHPTSSARRGLLEVCESVEAVRLVIGAAGEAPQAAWGEGESVAAAAGIELGSVGLGLLQSANLPVAIAPHGFRAPAEARLSRITVAYSGSDSGDELVAGAAAVAADAGSTLRVASFHPRPRGLLGAAIGFRAEDEVVAAWEAMMGERAHALLDTIESSAAGVPATEVALGAGADWHEALRAIPWNAAEVLLIGSGNAGPLARMSLGSQAAKIVKHAPVPVVLVPRSATEQYTEHGAPILNPAGV